MKGGWLIASALVAMAAPARAELDLARASVERLPNGLTLIMLEDHSFPLVSTQMIYKSGSRDETAGKTGLAHFLEHLAFRASAAFPNAGATDAIYNAGGEWHGYTWLDQTSYYSTMPADGLELLLRIEADRMANVTIDPTAIEVEKGAVVTEMHSYENDPDSVLLDALTAASIQAHPYRNNTIGLESDVQALTLADARAFYERHYGPKNAVLAIAGDFDPMKARALVSRTVGAVPAREAPVRTKSLEPPQQGERRIMIAGPVKGPRFAIAFPAPAASSRDLPAYLVLQQLLGGGSGVNFRQNDWGTPVLAGSVLDGAAEELATWMIPTADPYRFVIKGQARAGQDTHRVEAELERRLATIGSLPAADLGAAKAAVLRQLVEDVESTEDAAHQLAFFEGLGALDSLLQRQARVTAVSNTDIARVASIYLTPQQRTVAWMVPGKRNDAASPGAGQPVSAALRGGQPPRSQPASAPMLQRLGGGLPLLIQTSRLSPTVTVQLLMSAPTSGAQRSSDLAGLAPIYRSGPAGELPTLLDSVTNALDGGPAKVAPPSQDPAERMQQLIERAMNLPDRQPAPLLLVIAGDVDPETAAAAAARTFGSAKPGRLVQPLPVSAAPRIIRETIDRPLSQGSLGYAVRTPSPGSKEGLAARLLLYILTHDYSGRLGRSAITDKGLAYHIYSALRTDGVNGWATIWTGVDPAKAGALETEFRAQIVGLISSPPTAGEIAAAKQHLLGRDLSSAQTNKELASKLTREFVESGGIRSHQALKQALGQVTAADLAKVARSFAAGTIIRVDIADPRLGSPGGAKGAQ